MGDKLKLKTVVSDESSDEEEKGELDLHLEKLNLGPKRKLLVLCLGGLLANWAQVKVRDGTNTVQELKPDIVRYGKFIVMKRPFCTEFMKFCFDRFEVGLWSSERDHNIDDALLSCITAPGMRSKLAFVWGRDECTDSGFGWLRKEGKPIFIKDLKNLWDKKYYHSLPWGKGQYSASNTLLIDDEPHNCLLNPPDTAIFPQYSHEIHDPEDKFLGPNRELRGFLEGLVDADDVPTYVKEHRIGQPAITPSHTDWSYYAKIVRKFGKEEEIAGRKESVESTSSK